MKTKQHIHFSALLLLVLYCFGNSPAIVFHHHQLPVAYEQATGCEKNIYYSAKADDCGHQKHLSKNREKCLLCDHHNVTSHVFYNPVFTFVNSFAKVIYNASAVKLVAAPIAETATRGPPAV